MTHEQTKLRKLLNQLTRAERKPFPCLRESLDAPDLQGVYIIYEPLGRVVHVGCTPRARGGIAQRLRDHMANRSSFTTKFLEGEGSKLRRGYHISLSCREEPKASRLIGGVDDWKPVPRAHWPRLWIIAVAELRFECRSDFHVGESPVGVPCTFIKSIAGRYQLYAARPAPIVHRIEATTETVLWHTHFDDVRTIPLYNFSRCAALVACRQISAS